MTKRTSRSTNIKSNILNLINLFNFLSKCIGFAVTKSDDSFVCKFLREIIFFGLLLFALYCTIRAELWCIRFLNIGLDMKKLVVFVVNQLVIFSPLSCLVYYRLCDLHVWKIILKIRRLEENLIFCNMYLEIRRIGSMSVFFWCFQFFIIMGTMYFSLWPTLAFFLIDSICMFYFEAWVTIPYLQFVGWISFLCYVSCRVQHSIVDINNLEYLTSSDFCKVKSRLARMTWEGYEFEKHNQIKSIIGLMKQVLSISNELSAAYGTTVLFYIANYVSRSIIQFYDLIDKDAQKFPMWVSAWNVVARIIFILPLFICCEQLTYNVNKTVKLIQEIVILHQPSCLDCIIMTTALAFLLLQLQF